MQINWRIDRAQVRTHPVGELAQVIQSCWWRVTATEDVVGPDGEVKTLQAQIPGFTSFSDPDPANFIPFDQINQATVLPWVWAKLLEEGNSKEALEANVSVALENLRNPPLEVKQIPL